MKLGIENTTSFSHVTYFFHIQVRPDLETDFQTHISPSLDLLSDWLDCEHVEPKWYFDIGLRSIPIDRLDQLKIDLKVALFPSTDPDGLATYLVQQMTLKWIFRHQ